MQGWFCRWTALLSVVEMLNKAREQLTGLMLAAEEKERDAAWLKAGAAGASHDGWMYNQEHMEWHRADSDSDEEGRLKVVCQRHGRVARRACVNTGTDAVCTAVTVCNNHCTCGGHRPEDVWAAE